MPFSFEKCARKKRASDLHFCASGSKNRVKSGVFQCFSRLFHRKIGKIPVFFKFFVIFRRGCLRLFLKSIAYKKILRVIFLREFSNH
ncbi:MAG: hypothetical protein A2Y12_11940 [Planctomycetes bacterium GWF2_42_9]|nr:MAG: hypothetical protein A2Y12_11940 [Planctomycetes bacterium GWF2_42_9]